MTPSESGAEIRANALYLDGVALNRKNHSVRDLAYVLGSLGSVAIVDSIEKKYVRSLHNSSEPKILRPSIRVMYLGMNRQEILTKFGHHNRSNIHKSLIEIAPNLHDHWRTVIGFNFIPEIESMVGNNTHSQNFLMLRNPNTDPIPITPLDNLPAALGFIEPTIIHRLKPRLLKAFQNDDDATYSRLYDQLTDARYEAVDFQKDKFGVEYLPAAQIGMMIEIAKLGVELQGEEFLLEPSGYTSELQTAKDFAKVMLMDEVDSILGMEITRIKMLRDNKATIST